MKVLNLKQRNNILMMLLFGALGLNVSWKSFNSTESQLNLASNAESTVTCDNAVYGVDDKKTCEIKVTTDSEGSKLTHTSTVTFTNTNERDSDGKRKILFSSDESQMCAPCYLGDPDTVYSNETSFTEDVNKIAQFIANKHESQAIAAAQENAEEEALNKAELDVEECRGTLDTIQDYKSEEDRRDRSYRLVFKLNDGSAHILRKLDPEDKTECKINQEIDKIRDIVKTDRDGDEDDEKTEAAQIKEYQRKIAPRLRELLSSDDESDRELALSIIEDLEDELDLPGLSYNAKVMADGADLNRRFKQNLADYQSAVQDKNPFAQNIALNRITENHKQYQNSLYDSHRRTNPTDPFHRIFSSIRSLNQQEYEHWGEELEPAMSLLRQGEFEKATNTAQNDSQTRSSVVTLSTQQVANRLARAQGPSSSSANKLTQLPFDQSVVQKAMNRAALSNYQTVFTDTY